MKELKSKKLRDIGNRNWEGFGGALNMQVEDGGQLCAVSSLHL